MDFLTRDQIANLTGRIKRHAQRDVLTAIGIPFIIRPDGTLIVESGSIKKALGSPSEPVIEPDYAAITRNARAKKSTK